MAVPTVKVECAFASKPTDVSYTWTDITSSVLGLNYSRGHDNEFDDMAAGTSTITLKDNLGRFDPRNTSSPYYPNVLPEKPIRATLGTGEGLFQHYAERWPRSTRVGNVYAERTVTGSDGFAQLAQSSLAVSTFATEITGARIGHVLDLLPGWPAGRRNIATGTMTVVGGSYDATENVSALELMQRAARDEDGSLFVNGNGVLTFYDREFTIRSPVASINFTLTDEPGFTATTLGQRQSYIALEPNSDHENIRNQWSGTRVSDFQGTVESVQTVSDSTSSLAYSTRTQTIDNSLLPNDPELYAQLQWKLALYKDPRDRIDRIVVQPAPNSALWALLALYELGSRVTVREQPPGFTSALSSDYIVRKIDVSIPADLRGATFTYGLQPVIPTPASPWLIFDSGTKGLFDVNRFGY